ncbi:MAG: hypothetical protein IT250_01475 [Chitinophagaceae bacterium]|nr:hypothetical protein [Chitinophagaceae bacterium]
MKIYCFVAVVFLLSCKGKDEQPIIFNDLLDIKQIDCESGVELCNRKPGLKFTGFAPRVVQNKPDWNLELRVDYYPDKYTLTICCDSIPRLIDSLSMMFELLESYKRDKPERAERTCLLPDSVSITTIYVRDLSGTGEFYSLEFGKIPERSVFFITQKKTLEKLIEDIKERFSTCCLQ